MLKRVKTSLAVLALFVGTAVGSAHAASLSTDVSISIAPTIGLYCFDEVDVDLSASTYIAAIGRNRGRPMPSLVRNARARTGRLIANANRRVWNRGRYRFRRRVNLDLRNVCAYYSIGGIGGARVQIDALETQLDAVGGSFIKIDRVRTRDHEKAGSWRRRFRITPAELGNGTSRGIDVRLRLDMGNALEPGVYSSPVDGTFRITVLPAP